MVEETNGYSYVNRYNSVNDNGLSNMKAYPGYNVDFESVLKEQMNKSKSLQFSKHAQERVVQRGIEITETLMNRLNDAVGKAREKGARDIVVIVNIPCNVVVTTMSGKEMKNNIFTNIDSAVIL